MGACITIIATVAGKNLLNLFHSFFLVDRDYIKNDANWIVSNSDDLNNNEPNCEKS